ncbi:type II secretion system protein GspM [Luteimonas sp. 22616]|uniref:type II secretion system protein GspM n=1 Tax=Luteimonas sp. 22616 TaxID=3453951 RepID=UPI003F858854
MRAASPDRDRWLALGILALLLGLAYLVLVHPWWTAPMLEVDGRIGDLQQRDLRARMELRQAPEVGKRLQALRAQAASVPGFMPQRSPELATSALVQRLETAVLEASPGNRSCAIINRSPLTEARQQRFPRVAVQVRLRCGNPELAAVLHSLEGGSPRLFVDNLNVLTLGSFRSRGDGDAQGSGGLDVSFDLYGYLQPPPGAPADAR